MKHSKIILVCALILGILVSCAQSGNNSLSYEDAASKPATPVEGMMDKDAIAQNGNFDGNAAYGNGAGDLSFSFKNSARNADSISGMISSSAAIGSPVSDTNNKFIRTADVNFRVRNVRNSTFAIEKITAHYGGYVALTTLQSSIDHETRTKISDDSTLISTYFTASNNMVLRVPVEHLDSTLRIMGKLAEFLDYRSIRADNATLMILRERLATRRINRSTARLEDAVDETNAKLRDRAAIEEALYNKQTAADESYLRTLELKDRIRYSTITLKIYQRQEIVHEMVANEPSINAYRPSFWTQAAQAIVSGWNGLLSFVIMILPLWPMLIIVLAFLAIFKFFSRSGAKKS